MLLATASTEHVKAYAHAAAWLIHDTHTKKHVGNLLTCHQPLAALLEPPKAERVLSLKLGQSTVDTLLNLLRFHRDALMLFDEQIKMAIESYASIAYPHAIPTLNSQVPEIDAFLGEGVDISLRDEMILSSVQKYMFLSKL